MYIDVSIVSAHIVLFISLRSYLSYRSCRIVVRSAPRSSSSRQSAEAANFPGGLFERFSRQLFARLFESAFGRLFVKLLGNRKTTKSKRNKRRSHHRVSSVNIIEDKKSGEYKLSHHVDLKSGFYNGKKILDI